MINVDEVTAPRLIFAPMGVFFGKCCGNATLKKVGALNNVRSELLRPAQSQDCKLGRISHEPPADDASSRLPPGVRDRANSEVPTAPVQITGFTFISIKQVHGGAASRSKSAMHSMWMSIGGKPPCSGDPWT